jgi:hypothetical protein
VRNDPAYLPCYVIPAVTSDGYRLLPFTAADARASDPYLEDVFRSWDDLRPAGESVLRLELPPKRFPAWDAPAKVKGTFSLHRVGSYLTPHGIVFQLWCPDVETRRAAALERALHYDGEGRRADEDLTAFLGRVSARLELGTVLTIADVTAYSRRTGRGSRGI